MSNYEHCAECDALTGRAGKHDDSLYHAHEGPFCAECYEAWDEKVIAERDTLRADLETANSMLVATSKAGIQLREQVAGLEAKWRTEHDTANAHIMAHDAVRAELAALKSAQVVMPERRIQALAGVSLFDLGHAKGWNACIDEVARLNRSKT